MDAILSLHHSEMSEEDIQELAFELTQSLNQETDLTAKLPEETGGPGTKGDVVTIGQIVLAAVSSGGALVALLPVLKAYVARTPKLCIELKTADGNKVKIKAEHIRPGQIEQIAQAIKQLCDSGNG